MYASGLDVDPSGNVYIADTGNDQVAAYGPTGKQLWRVGVRGTKQLGRFNNPRDVAYLSGKLYVDDTGWNRVQVLDASNGAADLAVAGALRLDARNHRRRGWIGQSRDLCQRGHPEPGAGVHAGGWADPYVRYRPGSGPGQLNAPRDAATDSAGNVYVADYNNNRIAKFSPTGAPLKGWGTRGSANGQFIRPYGVAVDAANRVYVADSDNNRIQQFTATGGYLRTYGTAGTGSKQFFQLRRVAVGTGSSPWSTEQTCGATRSCASPRRACTRPHTAARPAPTAASTSRPAWPSTRRRSCPTASTSGCSGSPPPPAPGNFRSGTAAGARPT